MDIGDEVDVGDISCSSDRLSSASVNDGGVSGGEEVAGENGACFELKGEMLSSLWSSSHSL